MAVAASSPKLISLLLLTLLFIQIHARESHFFSKIPNNVNNNGDNFDTKETTTQFIPNNKVDPAALNNNPDKKTSTIPPDQEPNFIPQTQDNSYGLYGHESGQLPPNSDAKLFSNDDALPAYKSESEDQYYNNNNNNNNNYNNDNFQNSNTKPYENSFYYNKDFYDNGRQSSFHNTRLSQDNYYPTTNNPSYDQQKYENNNNKDFYYNNGGDNANNVERQGMSDTRFMENGKYYYDLNRPPHHYNRPRGSFGNNNNGNNGNTYEYRNSAMGRFQNNDEAEFQEESDEFVP